jgi:hypothetical protein
MGLCPLTEMGAPRERNDELKDCVAYVFRPPADPRSAPRPGKRKHGHNESVQGCDGETSVAGRSPGHRGLPIGPHLASPQTGSPALPPADFDLAYDLAKRITRTKRTREAFECNRRFWDIIFKKAERPIRKLDDRMTRYYPPLLELYPTPESRPRQHEALIEIYRKGEIAEAFQSFKKIYLKMVDQLIDHLNSEEADEPAR